MATATACQSMATRGRAPREEARLRGCEEAGFRIFFPFRKQNQKVPRKASRRLISSCSAAESRCLGLVHGSVDRILSCPVLSFPFLFCPVLSFPSSTHVPVPIHIHIPLSIPLPIPIPTPFHLVSPFSFLFFSYRHTIPMNAIVSSSSSSPFPVFYTKVQVTSAHPPILVSESEKEVERGMLVSLLDERAIRRKRKEM